MKASLLTALGLVTLVACGGQPRSTYQVVMHTQTDDGRELADVEVFHNKQSLGTSTSSGKITIAVDATGGSTLDVQFNCPSGYNATRDNILIPLRDTGSSEYAVTLECRPDKRNAVLVVNANMANVPIRIGRDIVGETDATGTAYIALNYPPKHVFEVFLDTKTNMMLKPQTPEFPFVMPDHDEVFVLEQDFHIEQPPPPAPVVKKKRKKKKKKVEKVPTKTGPVRINAGEKLWDNVKKKEK